MRRAGSESEERMKRREANFELLRIVAMLMIITLHYLDKGGILPKAEEAFSPAGYLAWALEALCVCSVNVYVLISAYFLADREYQPMRAVKIWRQVLFYSLAIAVVFYVPATITVYRVQGSVPLSTFSLYEMLHYIFPIVTEHYWFATSYILMTLFAPLLNEGLKKLPRKQYRLGVVFLVLLLSVSKSVLPVTLETDRLGYDAIWFLCLYLIGTYIRLRENETAREKLRARKPFAGYLFCSAAIFASLVIVHAFYEKTGSLAGYINRQYQYNSIFCLAASVCLFLAFQNICIPEGKLAAAICRIAGTSFGVYLIHEHLCMRYLWNQWLHTAEFADTPLFLLHWAVSVVVVYAACMCVEFGRQKLFSAVGRVAARRERTDVRTQTEEETRE